MWARVTMRLHLFLVPKLRASAKIDPDEKTCYRLQNIDDYMSTTNFDFWQLTKPIIERFMLSTISTVSAFYGAVSFEMINESSSVPSSCTNIRENGKLPCRSASNNGIPKRRKSSGRASVGAHVPMYRWEHFSTCRVNRIKWRARE